MLLIHEGTRSTQEYVTEIQTQLLASVLVLL